MGEIILEKAPCRCRTGFTLPLNHAKTHVVKTKYIPIKKKDPGSILEFLGIPALVYCHLSAKSKLFGPFSPSDDQKQLKNDKSNFTLTAIWLNFNQEEFQEGKK